ncbi:RHS repeat-associated core domain-containing protein, partial [Candidatus Roizmanbacteria bacterium]|nr:RHS repeat-associated core domain-containing protein [Candidatus Roizmanbacteria bacterium]
LPRPFLDAGILLWLNYKNLHSLKYFSQNCLRNQSFLDYKLKRWGNVSSTSTVSNAGVTTTNANDKLVYTVGITVPTTVNVATGFTQEWATTSATATTSEMSDKIQATAGATGVISASHNGGTNSNITHLIALKPATSGTAGGAFIYDANGNMTSDGVKCYHFNEANQLDKVTNCANGQTVAEYVYDYNGNRMVKRNFVSGVLDNTVTSWSDAFETKAASGGAITNTSYYFANGELVGKKDNSGAITYVHNDHLGSSSVITNQTGALVEATNYGPWGEIKSGGTQSKFEYTGQEHDGETGLNYYNARYYNSDIRRFTQPDDIIPDLYNPQTLNRYSYVNNNPLKYTDPSGHGGVIGGILNILTKIPGVSSLIAKIPGANTLLQMMGETVESPVAQKSSAATGQNIGKQIVSNPTVQKTATIVTNITKQVGNSIDNTAKFATGTIYKAVNESGITNYIGKTINYERRAQEWLRQGRITEKVKGLELLPEEHLSGVEQAAIERDGLMKNGGTLLNKINSISPNNPIYPEALRIGNKYLDDIGY